jgi:hypothetical protein
LAPSWKFTGFRRNDTIHHCNDGIAGLEEPNQV